jgi:hypothetical protein
MVARYGGMKRVGEGKLLYSDQVARNQYRCDLWVGTYVIESMVRGIWVKFVATHSACISCARFDVAYDWRLASIYLRDMSSRPVVLGDSDDLASAHLLEIQERLAYDVKAIVSIYLPGTTLTISSCNCSMNANIPDRSIIKCHTIPHVCMSSCSISIRNQSTRKRTDRKRKQGHGDEFPVWHWWDVQIRHQTLERACGLRSHFSSVFSQGRWRIGWQVVWCVGDGFEKPSFLGH